MKPKWIFERDAYQDGNVEIMKARCDALGIPYGQVEYVLFGSDNHITWPFGPEEVVIVYGSIGFARHVNRKLKWYPGAWCDFEKLRCTSYLAHWGQFSVQKQYAMMPLNEVKRLKDQLFKLYGNDDTIFIRPDSNDKIFHGEKVHYSQFEKWWRVANIYEPSPEQLTMVSTPEKIEIEWRFVIADRKAITGSRYIHSDDGNIAHAPLGEHEEDENARRYAESIANSCDWQPAPIYTLDVCRLATTEFRLLECGSVNTSGLYKCDLPVIMEAAENIAMREWNELNA